MLLYYKRFLFFFKSQVHGANESLMKHSRRYIQGVNTQGVTYSRCQIPSSRHLLSMLKHLSKIKGVWHPEY